jgi:acetyl-CoA C-acetyltransferase
MIENSTPILVGGGQFTDKEETSEKLRSPMDLAAISAETAIADTGLGKSGRMLLVKAIDTIAVVRLFADSHNRPRMSNSFGRAQNPPRAIASRIGAEPANSIYGSIGGNTPQKFINEMAQRISEGDVEIVLLAGAEAIRTTKQALRKGLTLNWEENSSGSLEDRGQGEIITSAHELAHGVGIPVNTYPLFEQAIRGELGHNVKEHFAHMGAIFAPFSEVAADNPFATFRTIRTVKQLAAVTEDNRLIGFPYPKFVNAMENVNQSASVIMTSVGKARELGIDPSKWIFLHGCAEANDKLLPLERIDYHSSPAMNETFYQAFEMAELDSGAIDYFDLYSCFPAAVQIACKSLKIDVTDRQGLTLTGGLPFFGGPGNNYSMHAIVEIIKKLRDKRQAFGMITAIGGCLTKHAAGIYSATPSRGRWGREKASSYQLGLDDMPGPEVTKTPHGESTVETYTVVHKKGEPDYGIVIAREKLSGRRFVSNIGNERGVLNAMLDQDFLGRSGFVNNVNGKNTISFT